MFKKRKKGKFMDSFLSQFYINKIKYFFTVCRIKNSIYRGKSRRFIITDQCLNRKKLSRINIDNRLKCKISNFK